ncbi:MAG: hypothetical protein Q4C99_06680 [Clostridia bacterium]|nr:hypothetical protein [Clostridia bacterium]
MEQDYIKEAEELKYINSKLVGILSELEEKYEEIGRLIKEFHEIIGENDEATVDNDRQVKKLLNKYSNINKY